MELVLRWDLKQLMYQYYRCLVGRSSRDGGGGVKALVPVVFVSARGIVRLMEDDELSD